METAPAEAPEKAAEAAPAAEEVISNNENVTTMSCHSVIVVAPGIRYSLIGPGHEKPSVRDTRSNNIVRPHSTSTTSR